MENLCGKPIKTLITLTDFEYKAINIMAKKMRISKSKLISEMIRSYILRLDNWGTETLLVKRGIKQEEIKYTEMSQVIKELSEKWKKN